MNGTPLGYYARKFNDLRAEFPNLQCHFAEFEGEALAVMLIDQFLAGKKAAG